MRASRHSRGAAAPEDYLVEEIDLQTYKAEAKIRTWGELALRIGARDGRQAKAWATGAERPQGARALEQISLATGGRVGVNAMHKTRLEWERANRPPVEGLPGDRPVRVG